MRYGNADHRPEQPAPDVWRESVLVACRLDGRSVIAVLETREQSDTDALDRRTAARSGRPIFDFS